MERIPDLPSAGYYIPNFITQLEEESILDEIQRLPNHRWTVLSHRRLLSLPSTLAGNARDTLIATPLPNFLSDPIVTRFKSLGLFNDSPHNAPNHVLINEYEPGQGIMPHEDGPAYYPITATVSLKSHTVLEIYEKTENGERNAEPTWRILQEPRSLLITTGKMYTDTLHGISEKEDDQDLEEGKIVNWPCLGDSTPYLSGKAQRDTRVSLTYRDVLKVTNLGGAMKLFGRK